MKFVLAYTICSAITGFCNTPAVHPVKFNTWTDCTKAGATVTIKVTNEFKEKFEQLKQRERPSLFDKVGPRLENIFKPTTKQTEQTEQTEQTKQTEPLIRKKA